MTITLIEGPNADNVGDHARPTRGRRQMAWDGLVKGLWLGCKPFREFFGKLI
jgi:hypothetical protein